MNVQQIVEKHLCDNGYDGLVNTQFECACFVGDIAPCGDMAEECQAGYKGPCVCGEGCEADIYVSREKAAAAKARQS